MPAPTDPYYTPAHWQRLQQTGGLPDLLKTGGWLPANAIDQTVDRMSASAAVTLTSGTLLVAGGFVIPGGRAVSSISGRAWTGVTTRAKKRFCLGDWSRNVLATTVDDT